MKIISASLVKELRERTGISMMDCKKALIESGGNVDLAIEELKKSSRVKVAKRERIPVADGIIATFSKDSLACMVEINCETDFVAKEESFINYSEEVITRLASNIDFSLKELMEGDLEEERIKLIQHLGENIVVRRIARSEDTSDSIGMYLHSNKKIASIVSLKGGNQITAKDIAMHVAATDPISISPKDISKEIIDSQKEMFEAQSANSGKPSDIVKRIVDGKLKKYLVEVCLIEQEFVKEPKKRIRDLLDQNKAKVIGFKRFEVGEGIEIKKKDFAAEVKSQIKDL